MLRAHLSDAVGQRCDEAIPVLDAARIGRQSFVFREIAQAEGVRARAPLPIASYRDDERPICGFEQLVGDKIRMRVSPSLRVTAGNENVLRYVDECRARTVRQ